MLKEVASGTLSSQGTNIIIQIIQAQTWPV